MNNKNTDITLASTIKCPNCEHSSNETMPTDSCQYFWECPSCGEVIKPEPGDCCVFCSYGSHPCPPVQQEKNCCN
ncbi:GDCCVxC domain-containing (seleno)protein [Fodinibius halophilus]|uniref:Uncharacterized protein n=1 Tax=Fodinibius halophilus TaxID=1736908 RepID=A0A6M1T1V1_9BACT|nr:GDCCVxC domain-containing (seleno)protein [Fodinibius halophilus]NGP90038.1 hypothetical protein [Fodinibius halophilus]